jgi:hypothetical protein
LTKLAVLIALFASLAAAGASAAPDDGVRIRHGAGVGRMTLGMTHAQVRRILGGPQTVDRRERLRDGRRYLQFSWDYAWWTVGFLGRPGKLRVALIQTLNIRQRTVEGLGVGSRERTVRRALHVRCTEVSERARPVTIPFERRCSYASHRGRETTIASAAPTSVSRTASAPAQAASPRPRRALGASIYRRPRLTIRLTRAPRRSRTPARGRCAMTRPRRASACL